MNLSFGQIRTSQNPRGNSAATVQRMTRTRTSKDDKGLGPQIDVPVLNTTKHDKGP